MAPIGRFRGGGWLRQGILVGSLLAVSLVSAFCHLLTAPAGINGDAARLGIHAWDFLTRGIRPFYVFHQFAPKPLLVYLQAAAFALLGSDLAVLKGVTAFVGALSAPLAYWGGLELFRDRGERFARRAGLIAALGLALSPSFAAFNRYGFETALLPPLELLTIAALFRGLRRRSRVWLLVAGLTVGLSQYSYIVARAFPVALGLALLLILWSRRNEIGPTLRQLGWTVIGAVVVAAPQWYLFVRAPYTFLARTGAADSPLQSGLLESVSALAVKAAHQLVALTWHWHNGYDLYSGRPVLTLPLALGLLVAIALVLRRRRQTSLGFVVALSGLMLVPDLLVDEGVWPQATRLSSAVAPIYLAAAGGLAAVWSWLEGRIGFRWAGALLVSLLLVAGLEAQLDMTRRVIPAIQKAEGLEWRASLVEIAEAKYILGFGDDVTVLLPSSEYQRPELAFLLAQAYPERAGGVPLPLTEGETVQVIVPDQPDRPTSDARPSGYLETQWVALKDGTAYFLPPTTHAFQPTSEPRLLLADNDALVATTFSARWNDAAPSPTAAAGSFSNGLRLVGYEMSTLTPGETMLVTLYLQPERQLEADVQLFVQMLDRNQAAITGVTDWPLHGVYRARAWRAGEVVPLAYELPVPADLTPGRYRLTMGVIDVISQERVPVDGGSDVATVAELKVPLPEGGEAPAVLSGARFGDSIVLDGYTLRKEQDGLHLRLLWRATAQATEDYTVFVHVVDAAGAILSQVDSQPRGGAYPTSIWDVGEGVSDEYLLPLPADDYRLLVGLYAWPSLERLPVEHDGELLPDGALILLPTP